MQTKAGGKKVIETMIKKHGSYEAWCEYMRENGRKGGKLGTTGGFYANRELARTAGSIGGKISKRPKAETGHISKVSPTERKRRLFDIGVLLGRR